MNRVILSVLLLVCLTQCVYSTVVPYVSFAGATDFIKQACSKKLDWDLSGYCVADKGYKYIPYSIQRLIVVARFQNCDGKKVELEIAVDYVMNDNQYILLDVDKHVLGSACKQAPSPNVLIYRDEIKKILGLLDAPYNQYLSDWTLINWERKYTSIRQGYYYSGKVEFKKGCNTYYAKYEIIYDTFECNPKYHLISCEKADCD